MRQTKNEVDKPYLQSEVNHPHISVELLNRFKRKVTDRDQL